MTTFFESVDELRRRFDVLQHPFYQRWTRGELSRSELGFYAGQYRHAVVALAAAAESVGGEHAAEEREHIALWDRFLASVDGDARAEPTDGTRACVSAWADPSRGEAATLAVLYAIESSQPAISETKRGGLVEHYGAASGTDAVRYFDVHASLDYVHAAEDRRKLEEMLGTEDEAVLLAHVEEALRGNWRLLDDV